MGLGGVSRSKRERQRVMTRVSGGLLRKKEVVEERKAGR
jgi:hypothetical protein